MKVFPEIFLFINPYGSLPSEGWKPYRTFMAAQYLALQGINVLWLLSDYNHLQKKRRHMFGCFRESGVPIAIIPTLFPYLGNISLNRFLFELDYGLKASIFLLANRAKIKTVVYAEPALPYSLLLSILCILLRIPYVIDVLDLWPEHFRSISSFKNPLVKLCYYIFLPCFLAQRKTVALLAKKIVTVSDTYRNAYSSLLSQKGTTKVVSIPIGVRLDKFTDSEFNFDKLSIHHPLLASFLRTSKKIVVYSGSYGECYDLENLTKSVRLYLSMRRDVRFLFLGTGPCRPLVKKLMDEFPDSVLEHLPVNHLMLPIIYNMCSVGICSYSKDSAVALPLKYFDYLASGLAILNNLRSEMAIEVQTFQVGLNYDFESSLDFAGCLDKILSSEETLKRFHQNSLKLSRKYEYSSLYKSYFRAVVNHV